MLYSRTTFLTGCPALGFRVRMGSRIGGAHSSLLSSKPCISAIAISVLKFAPMSKILLRISLSPWESFKSTVSAHIDSDIYSNQ